MVNGKSYVGSAINILSRWSVHLCELRAGTHYNKYLQRAWRKNGERSFQFSVLETCPKAALISREQFWMDRLGVVSAGYNIQPRARSNAGIRRSDQTLAKMRASAQRRVERPGHREHLSERAKKQWAKGRIGLKRPRSAEERAKISRSLRTSEKAIAFHINQVYDPAEMSRRSYCRRIFQ